MRRAGRWRIFLDLQNRAPMQVKLTFSDIYRFFRFFVFFKIDVLPAWELTFRVFCYFFWFFRFLCFGGHLKNSNFTCMRAQFSKTRSRFLRFFDIFGNAKKTCFHLPLFFMFFHHFWCFFGGLWASFGVLLEPLSSLWLSGVILLGAFGSPGLHRGPSLLLFVVSLARLGCLWARGPLRDCFLLHFQFILVSFFEQFGGGVLSFFDFSFER